MSMPIRPTLAALLLAVLTLLTPLPAARAQAGDDIVVQAREALRRKDKAALLDARMAISLARHPLAPWVEYWELQNRLPEAQQSELDAFAARWPGSYVEDRLRNDWLLELGKRRDWAHFRSEYPRFRMNDDREVTCYALLTQHLDGLDIRAPARAAWLAQRELDDGCALLAKTLFDAHVFGTEDAWTAARLAVETNRPRVARAAVALISPERAAAMGELLDNPVRFLARKPPAGPGTTQEMTLLAFMRMAGNDPEFAAGQIESIANPRLPLEMTATAWAHVAKQAAMKQLPQAADYARRAWKLWDAAAGKAATPPPWSDELLAWQARAALRQDAGDKLRWPLLLRAVEAMSAEQQHDATWVYWKARALQAGARAGPDGDAARAAARLQLESIAPQLGFYGLLASEDIGARPALPLAPLPPTPAEREAPRGHPGLSRALWLVSIGLRSEGVREWNFSLRGMQDRELLAAAQLACEREVYDRCISTSERTRGEIDIAQRFPLPFRDQVVPQARAAGLEPAFLYGLIRQESRFVMDARSSVGAAGLMQVMPATARWTARQVGMDFRPEMLAQRDINLQLGSAYLKRVLDDFGGSLTMAAAAYNAGPGRPRRWREGGTTMEPAAWAETIPFTETRDYVKKVIANSFWYAALLASPASVSAPTLKNRLGPPIGPANGKSANGGNLPDRDLP